MSCSQISVTCISCRNALDRLRVQLNIILFYQNSHNINDNRIDFRSKYSREMLNFVLFISGTRRTIWILPLLTYCPCDEFQSLVRCVCIKMLHCLVFKPYSVVRMLQCYSAFSIVLAISSGLFRVVKFCQCNYLKVVLNVVEWSSRTLIWRSCVILVQWHVTFQHLLSLVILHCYSEQLWVCINHLINK